MADETGLDVDQSVDGDPRHWRITSSEELFDPTKLNGTDFRAEDLFDLQEAGAFTEVGGSIIHAFGVVRQVTTRFDPEHPNRIGIIIDDDANLGNAVSYYQNLLMELTLQLAWTSGGSFNTRFC